MFVLYFVTLIVAAAMGVVLFRKTLVVDGVLCYVALR